MRLDVLWSALDIRWSTFGVLWSAFGCLWMTLDDLGGLLLLLVQSGSISLVPGRNEFGSFIISRLLS